MCHKKFIIIISFFQICQGAIERDLLLTPKKDLQVLGRTLYYDPSLNKTNGIIPWEQTLKHVTFLTLFAEAARNTNFSDLKEYKQFMESPYTRIQEEYPRFGDIITMARGRLENSKGYRFVEGLCEEHCSEKVLALWRVQKIRHRDQQRGFRYEMKFSVTPSESDDSTHTINNQYLKSFILKDDDYPASFNALQRRSDSVENFSNERQARIINEIPRRENTLLPHLPPLNIGEYFKEVPKASSKVSYISNTRSDFPTTYRPHYHPKFTKSEVFEKPEEPKTVVTHHFHHHYFMQDADTSLQYDQQLFHSNTDAIQIIKGPKAELLSPQYAIPVHSIPYTTTTAAPSPPAIFYMQPIPLYIQSFPQKETTSERGDTKPFKKSEQQFEEIRYSDPDPLYENVDNLKGSSESASAEIHLQVEKPNPEILISTKSSSTQLPPPAKNQNRRVPYVEGEENETTTNQPTVITTATPSTRRTLLPKNKYFISTSTSENPLKYASKLSLHKIRNYPRSTTEQPVLKWKPKRKIKENTSSERSDNAVVESSTEERVVTVTPSSVDINESEILTQKSVSKSISVKVGNHSKEIPLTIETGTTVSSEVKGYDYGSSDGKDSKP